MPYSRRLPQKSKLTKRAMSFRKAVRANKGRHTVARSRVREGASSNSYKKK